MQTWVYDDVAGRAVIGRPAGSADPVRQQGLIQVGLSQRRAVRQTHSKSLTGKGLGR
jgi:hypothetical protein